LECGVKHRAAVRHAALAWQEPDAPFAYGVSFAHGVSFALAYRRQSEDEKMSRRLCQSLSRFLSGGKAKAAWRPCGP
jgi:hypothetical protein